jgi:hypothetical protein
MSRKKLRIHNTDIENLVSNLRGEVGEIIVSWILWRNHLVEANSLRTGDPVADLENRRLVLLDILADKLGDEIVARLSELSEPEIGKLTFYFANEKLSGLDDQIEDFRRFVIKNRLRRKRNTDISHKELPEKWSDHREIYISYSVIVRAIAMSLRLMKLIDAKLIGPGSKYFWREIRRRRYTPTAPPKIGYWLMSHIWLPPGDREAIVREESTAGIAKWIDMPMTINGFETTVKAYGRYGALMMSGRLVLLPEAFVSLTSMDWPADADGTDLQ